MSSHATAETLSAYIDRELPDAEVRQIEEHLADCTACQKRFTGMRNVVASLSHLDRLAPPSTLEQIVARRVAFDGEQKGLIDRLESSMRTFERQSSMLALFGVVIAFAVMILLFAQALEQRRNATIPVVFNDPLAERASRRGAVERREVAGRLFHRRDEVWIEDGVDSSFARVVVFDSPLWKSLLGAYPELAEIRDFGAPVVVDLAHEGVLRFESENSSR